MSAEPFPRVEWDFDAVPKEELVACGYWEYARESVFIQQTYKRCSEDPKSACEDVETIRSIGWPAELWFEDEESVRRRGFPDPWQSLAKDTQEELVDIMQYRPDPIVARGDTWVADMIAKAAKEQEGMLAWEMKDNVVRLRKDRSFPSVRWTHGVESFIVDIAWEHYNDEYLVQAFRKWVGEARPDHMKKPKRAGHQLRHWRVALRRLGMMRLNYHCTRHRLRSWYPAAWERFRDYYKEWYEAPRHVEAFYNKLFPFSHAMFDDPIHFQPKRKGKRWGIYSGPDGKVKFSP